MVHLYVCDLFKWFIDCGPMNPTVLFSTNGKLKSTVVVQFTGLDILAGFQCMLHPKEAGFNASEEAD